MFRHKIASFSTKHLPSKHVFRPILKASLTTPPTTSTSHDLDTNTPETQLKQVLDKSFKTSKNKIKQTKLNEQSKKAEPIALNPEISATPFSLSDKGKGKKEKKKKTAAAAPPPRKKQKKNQSSIFDDY